METNKFIDQLFERAKRAGFEACEAYLSEGESFETSVYRGERTAYNVAESINLGFRGLLKGQMGCASTQILDEDAVEMLICAAKSSAELCETEAPDPIVPQSPSYPEIQCYNPEIERISAAEKIDLARALEQAAMDFDPRIVPFDGTGVYTLKSHSRLVNSLGMDLESLKCGIGAYVNPTAKSNDQTAVGLRQIYTRLPEKLNAELLAREAGREAVDFLDAKSIESGIYPILLRGDVSASLLKTYSGLFSADRAQKGLSLLKGREGQKIAADCVCLTDDPLLTDGRGSCAFDGEGISTRKKRIVEAGKLQTLMHNLKTARKAGVQTTGNAERAGYAGPMRVSPSNFYFEPSDLSREALFKAAGRALFITDLMGLHSGTDAVSGDFSLAAKGYLIENGKIGRPVNQITLAGNYLKLLTDIEAVAQDLEFGANRFGSPTVLVRGLSVAGK